MDLLYIAVPMMPSTQLLLEPSPEDHLALHGSIGFCTRTVPGSLLTRISSAAMGTLLGGFVALPLGWLQSTLQAELNPVQEQEALQVQLAEVSRPKPKYEQGKGVDAVIRRLESRVPEPALRSHE